MDRSKNAIKGMVAKCLTAKPPSPPYLALYDPVNELKLAALIKSLYESEGIFWK